MTGEQMLNWLNREIENVPSRWPGVDLYSYMVRQTEMAAREEREALVVALSAWLRECREPESMLAVEIARTYRLSELRMDLQWVASEIRARRAFLPYYEEVIMKALEALDAAE